MTFWQSMCFKAMTGAGFVDAKHAAQIQNLVTCIEMLLASLAHFYIFPYYEWADDYKREKEKRCVGIGINARLAVLRANQVLLKHSCTNAVLTFAHAFLLPSQPTHTHTHTHTRT